MFQTKLLLVDDSLDQSTELSELLCAFGFHVDLAKDGEEMRWKLQLVQYDVVLMDINLPGANGLELTKRIRRASDIPVIMTTGRTSQIDRVIGLEIGADDYVTKPIDARELVARINAVLRRTRVVAADEGLSSQVLIFHGYHLDPNNFTLRHPDGKIVSLTKAEFGLLNALVRRPGRAQTRDMLMDHTFGPDHHTIDRSIDNLIMRLRYKLGEGREFIRSVRGVGYMFTEQSRCIAQSSSNIEI